jgi:hypothetical protein
MTPPDHCVLADDYRAGSRDSDSGDELLRRERLGARIPLSGLDYCRSSDADRRGLQPVARAPSLAGVTATLALVPFNSP